MRWPCRDGLCDEVPTRTRSCTPPCLHGRIRVAASREIVNQGQGAPSMPSDGASVTQAGPDIPARASERALMSRLLRRGASGAFIVSIVGTALGLLANLVMARLIGRAEYGIYALMFSWVSVLVMVAQAGQDISIIRFLPGYIQDNAWGKVRGLRIGV